MTKEEILSKSYYIYGNAQKEEILNMMEEYAKERLSDLAAEYLNDSREEEKERITMDEQWDEPAEIIVLKRALRNIANCCDPENESHEVIWRIADEVLKMNPEKKYEEYKNVVPDALKPWGGDPLNTSINASS